MQAAMTQRKRSDWRTRASGGEFGEYLIGAYLHKMDWVTNAPIRSQFQQFHETERNSMGYVHLEGGKPAMKRAWLDALTGYEWQVVRDAIEMVRRIDPDAIAALEYYQLPDARRPTRYAFAASNDMCHTNISKLFARAVRRVREHLPQARKEWNEGRPDVD